MNAIKFLRQAHKADQLGYYKLADKFFNQAYRFAAGERVIEEALIKALEEAGIKGSEALSTEAILAAVDKAIAEAVVEGGDKSTLEALLRESGATEEEIVTLMEQVATKGAGAIEKEALVKSLSESLNGPMGIARRMKIGVPPSKPGFVDKVKEISGNAKQKFLQWYNKNPKRAKGILTLAGITIAGSVAGGIFYLVRNGKKLSDEETERITHEAQNDPYENMYQDRMKAGQQQRQDEVAQKWVNENKDKFKTQRDLYNAALGAGDENFANDVIAFVKRDIPTMDIGKRSKTIS